MHKASTFNAFTLAEVLLTLMIIGVIAVLTIPPFINAYNNIIYVSALKKTYSELQNILNLAEALGDPVYSWEYSTFTTMDYGYSISDGVYAHLKNVGKIEKCTLRTCPRNPAYNNGNIKDLNGNDVWDQFSQSAGFFMPSGARVYVQHNDQKGAPCQYNTVPKSQSWKNGWGASCAYVNIDINGLKKPNQIGRDIFSFILFRNGDLIPVGGYLTLEQIKSTGGGWGNCCHKDCGNGSKDIRYNACAARIMKEGWKMNY